MNSEGYDRSLTANLYNGLTEQIRIDQDLFKLYYLANTVQFEAATDETCDANCKLYHYCALSQQDYDMFEACVTEDNSRESNSSLVNMSSFLLFLLIVSIFNLK